MPLISIAKLCFVIISLFTISVPAYAYIDPGTGSMFLQLLIALVIGIFFKFKHFFIVIYRFIANLFKR